METIGEHLKRVRKVCGYSLEDVARVTKINLRYLEAIENDEFSKLPGETFLQGFLRSYAKFLGIKEKEIMLIAPKPCQERIEFVSEASNASPLRPSCPTQDVTSGASSP